ncbi:MAG: glycosyltransferase family 61 protein, partial [Okeania sp. SIO2H7]|nr:glycosyltransferase family 61 protein [Okeania sp. SIO2H7]
MATLSSLSGNVYYHWMIDVLPRIGILKNSTWSLDHIDWFVVNSLTHDFQQETLKAAGIPLERVIESDRTPYINAQTLVAPSFPGHLDWVSQGTIDFLRSTFLQNTSEAVKGRSSSLSKALQVTSPDGPRLYISRANARYRRVLNEAAVIDHLQSFGFIPIALETLSVAEQVHLFANAQAIISPHGSSLTNIVF